MHRVLLALCAIFGAPCLIGEAAAAGKPGRDFVPADWAADGELDLDGRSNFVLVDAFVDRAELWLFYIDPALPGAVRVDRWDPTTGPLGSFSGSPSTVLTPDTGAGSVEAHGINSAQVAACAPVPVTNDPLTWDGSRWRTSHIGVRLGRIVVTGSGGACAGVKVRTGTSVDGYLDGSTATTDGFALVGTGSCTSFTASYEYSTCGFQGAAAWRCPVEPDPVPDADAELGACRYLMMYEASHDGDGDATTPDDRVLLTAHASRIDSAWTRYLPSGGTTPTAADVRVSNTSQHTPTSPAGENSFVSVPTLWYDRAQALWRMWFVSEDTGRPSVRYTESDDDGQSWGIGGGLGGGIDCWDGAAFDAAACSEIAWVGTPPPDSTDGADNRTPDAVDPEVYSADLTPRPGAELAMMVTGGDDACPDADWGVQLVQAHPASGDQSTGHRWLWLSATAADPNHGVVVDADRGVCGGAKVLDPEVVRWHGGYLAFFNAAGGIHAAASGYSCSNQLDDDGDGGADWPDDPDCDAPWTRE